MSSQAIRGAEGATIIGPTNPAREAESRDGVTPPSTDHGTLPNLKWSFADSHNRLEEGGWARQTTIREMPIATTLAGVNMRLKAGAIREMHWHKEAEWAFKACQLGVHSSTIARRAASALIFVIEVLTISCYSYLATTGVLPWPKRSPISFLNTCAPFAAVSNARNTTSKT